MYALGALEVSICYFLCRFVTYFIYASKTDVKSLSALSHIYRGAVWILVRAVRVNHLLGVTQTKLGIPSMIIGQSGVHVPVQQSGH